VAESLAEAVNGYRNHGSIEELLGDIARLADGVDATVLATAVEPFISIPEVAGPIYERIVDDRPNDARALVILANAYWLSGRGPDVVGELATRAISADPTNRGAWHLWSLSESDIRERVGRWMQVVSRFPHDELAKANLADNAASLASGERDREALALAIETYDSLLATATHPAQREALEKALRTLRGWKL
jgi:hypothetical protein